MADNETRVVYRALADFAAVTRAARNARREIRELRAEEARLNAQSAATSGTAAAAHVRSANTRTAATRSNTDANRENNRSLLENVSATVRQGNAARAAAAAHTGAAGAADRASRAYRTTSGEAERLSRSSRRAAASAAEHERSATALGRTWERIRGPGERLRVTMDKFGKWHPHLIPPFVALIPVIAGVLALMNPLVAGLGAAGGAAIGFASSLGRMAGSAIAAVPALFTLISVVAAMKTAFGGIGGVFQAFSAAKRPKYRAPRAGRAGGAGTAPKLAELSLQEKLTRANEAYRRSVEDVKFASDDLNAARKDYIRRVKELQRAVDNAGTTEMRAAADVQLALEEYKRTLADPDASQGDRMAAEAAYKEALEGQQRVQEENKQNASDLNDMKKKGMAGDKSVIMAQRALTDAINAQRDAQLALVNVRRQDAQAAQASAGAADVAQQKWDAFNDALSKLSPSARRVVMQLIAMDDAWQAIKRATQEAFFSRFVNDIGRLRNLLPAVRSLLTDTAGAMGDVVSQVIKLITSPQWTSDLMLLGKGNVPIIRDAGGALLALLDTFRNLSVIAQPFLAILVRGFRRATENLRGMTDQARKTGSLGRWLMGDKNSRGVLETLRQWLRIVKNIGITIMNYSGAAEKFSNWMTDGFEAVTKGWVKSSEAAKKNGSPFQTWLENIKPALSEMKRMLSTFFSWFSRESGDTTNIDEFVRIFRIITDELGPALADLFDRLGNANVGSKFAEALTSVVDILAKLADSGAADAFFDALNKMLDIVQRVMDNPQAAALIGKLAVAFGAFSALTFVTKYTGIENLFGWLFNLKTLPKTLQTILDLIKKIAKAAGGVIFPGAAAAGAGAAARRGGGAAAGGAGGAYVPRRGEPEKSPKGPKRPKVPKGAAAGAAVEAATLEAPLLFATNLKVLARQFKKTGIQKDLFIANLRLLGDQFGMMGLGGKGGKAAKGAKAARAAGKAGKGAKGAAGAAGAAAVGRRAARRGISTEPRRGIATEPQRAGRRPLFGGNRSAARRGLPVGAGGEAARRGMPIAGEAAQVAKASKSIGVFSRAAGRLAPAAKVLGRGAKALAGPVGFIASIAGSMIGDTIAENAPEGRAGASQRMGGRMLSGAASGAGWGAMAGSLFGPVGTAVGAGVGAVVGAGASFFTAPKEDRDAFIEDTKRVFGNFFSKDLPRVTKGAGHSIWDGVQKMGDWLSEQWTNVTGWFTSLPQKVADAVSGAAGSVWGFLTGLPEWAEQQWANVQTWFADLPRKIGYTIGYLWGQLQDFGVWLQQQWSNAVAFAQTIPALLSAAVGNIWGGIKRLGTWLQEQWSAGVAFAQSLPGRLAAAVGDLWRNIKKLPAWFREQWNNAVAFARTIPTLVTNALGNIWRGIKSLGSWFQDQWTNAQTWVNNLPGRVAAAAGNFWSQVQGIGSWLTTQWDALVAWARRIPGVIKDAIGSAFGGFREGQKDARSGAGYNPDGTPRKRNGGIIGRKIRRAGGGSVPGSGNSDTVDAALTPGEFVVRKAITKRVGRQNMERFNAGVISFADLLRQVVAEGGPGTRETGTQFFNGGGLVGNNRLAGQFSAALGGGLRLAGSEGAGHTTIIRVEKLEIVNPKPETVETSLHDSVRRLNFHYGSR